MRRARSTPTFPKRSSAQAGARPDGHANPLKTGLGFYKNALAMGVKFITGEKVLELRKVKGRLRKVIAEHGEYEADIIMVCAGAQSKEILSTVGINAPVRPASIIAW